MTNADIRLSAGESLGRQAFRRLRKNRLAVLGAAIVAVMALACFLLPPLLELDPHTTSPELRHRPPSAE
ncbi:MAG TPA: hypothetical protein VFZ53_00545, partial [Polyangiaceae bacterium]